MKNRKVCLALTITLLLQAFFIQSNIKTVRALEADERIDLECDMSLTVDVSDECRSMMENLQEQDGELVYDLYKVADLKKSGNGFTYKIEKDFSYLAEAFSQFLEAPKGEKQENKEDWSKLSQMAAQKLLGEEESYVNASDKATYSGICVGAKQKVEKGLYLIVVRGSLENSTLVKNVTVNNSDRNDTTAISQQLVTCTLLGTTTFTVVPMLVCIPTKVSETGEIVNSTDEAGKWLYDQTVTLKMEAAPATGSIKINKTLTDYYDGAENATFVFQVDVYFPDENTLYRSEVYSTTFDAKGTKTITVEELPIGSVVKVYEIYSGANYSSSIEKGKSFDVVVKEDEPAEVTIINTYNKKTLGGGGITNHFAYDMDNGAGKWNWFHDSDNTETVNGVSDRFLNLFHNTFNKTVSN